jgi:H+-transporting ATPase
MMGSTVVRGEVEGTVEFTGADTFFGKTASLLGATNETSNLQKTLVSIVLVLTVLSVTFCLICLIYLLTILSVDEAMSFTVVLLVASIPMAIEIVTTTTLALGSKELSKEGAIVARLAAIEDMAGMSILCSDKTGTLTLNKMMIQEETPIYHPGETQYSLLRMAAMAARWKEPPRDALDTLVLTAVDMPSLNAVEQTDFLPFDPVVKRTEGTVVEKGKKFKVTKGAPHVLLKLVGDKAMEEKVLKDVEGFGNRGIRCMAIAKTVDSGLSDWKFLGLLTFLDPPRPDTAKTIQDAEDYGVKVKMITGDHLLIARETAKALRMGTLIVDSAGLPLLDADTKKKPEGLSRDYGDLCLASDGFAQVFPEHKYLIVECLREMGYKTGMTGDGVNDAPALKRADVGIAVAGATDAARAAADIILTEEGLSTIISGIIIARKIFVRIRNFIIYRVAATLQLLSFFFISVFAFKPSDYMPNDWESRAGFDPHAWPEYFHMPVLMLMLITLLNDGTLIAIGYDNVVPTRDPCVWNIPFLFAIGGVLAAIACISSLVLLQDMLLSWHEGTTMQNLGLGELGFGQIVTAIYLKVSISDFLTLFSARTGDQFFWSSKPAPILMGACVFSLSISTIIACTWPNTYPDGVKTEGMFIAKDAQGLAFWVWFYCILWWFVQDICKVVSWKLMKKYNWFGVNKTGAVEFNEQTLRFANQMKQDLGLNRKSMEGRRPSITSHASNSQLHAIAQPLVDV